MTRKDFEIIADCIRHARVNGDDEDWSIDQAAIDRVALSLADSLDGTNAQFNRHKFLVACDCGDNVE